MYDETEQILVLRDGRCQEAQPPARHPTTHECSTGVGSVWCLCLGSFHFILKARAKRLQNGPFAHWPCSLTSPLALPARANYWSQLHGASGEAAQTTDMNSSAAGYTTPTSRQHAAGAAAASLIHTRGGHGAACVALCSRQALATGRSVFLDKTSTFISSHLPPKYRAVDLHGHGCDASARVVRDRLVKKFGS